VVALRDVDVRVVAGRAVTLVEREVGDLGERDPVADQVVLDDLRGRDHDPGVLPERGAELDALDEKELLTVDEVAADLGIDIE